VGILFHFPEVNRFEFVKGDGYRAKAIYPDFNNSLFNGYIKNITEKVKNHVDLFNLQSEKVNFSEYIHNFILAEDAAGLVFRDSVQVKNVFTSINAAITEYSKLLLPGVNTEKPSVQRHNESFILTTFRGYLQERDKSVEKKLEKNQFIGTKNFKIKFELSYHNKIKHFIKPLSFDLTDELSIQNKAAITYCHLNDLIDYAKATKASFDFLIAKPQNNDLNSDYENALDYISNTKAPNKLITQDKWEEYTQKTFDFLTAN
jgi:hypothetical protein